MIVYSPEIDACFADPGFDAAWCRIPAEQALAFVMAVADQMEIDPADLADEAWAEADRRYHDLVG